MSTSTYYGGSETAFEDTILTPQLKEEARILGSRFYEDRKSRKGSNESQVGSKHLEIILIEGM